MAAGGTFRSAYNIYRWYLLRRNKKSQKLGPAEREIITDELQNLIATLPYVQADPRLGLHQEPQWQMYNPKILKQKIQLLKAMLAE